MSKTHFQSNTFVPPLDNCALGNPCPPIFSHPYFNQRYAHHITTRPLVFSDLPTAPDQCGTPPKQIHKTPSHPGRVLCSVHQRGFQFGQNENNSSKSLKIIFTSDTCCPFTSMIQNSFNNSRMLIPSDIDHQKYSYLQMKK